MDFFSETAFDFNPRHADESNACSNCGVTHGLSEVWLDDQPKPISLCDDCAAEARRMEALADQLAALPSCEDRQRVIDAAESTAQLVNALRAHDLAQCVYCVSTRATVTSDRLHVNPTAVCCEAA